MSPPSDLFEADTLQGLCQKHDNINIQFNRIVIKIAQNEDQPDFTITGTTLPFPESEN
jgi:hypothetical protein